MASGREKVTGELDGYNIGLDCEKIIRNKKKIATLSRRKGRRRHNLSEICLAESYIRKDALDSEPGEKKKLRKNKIQGFKFASY